MQRLVASVALIITAILLSAYVYLKSPLSEKTNNAETLEMRYRATTNKNFEDVMFDLEIGIGNENYNITGINSVGKVIAERHEIPYPNYAIVNSCNLESAKKFLDIDPEYVTIMPCRIAVWEQHGKVQIDAQLVPEDDPKCVELCADTNALLKRIVDFAAEE